MRRPQTGHVSVSPNGQGVSTLPPRRCQLPPDTLRHLELSLKRQLKRYRKGLKRCQQKFSPGAVHESRVETRRLLSVVELLQPFLRGGRVRKIRTTLKRHLDTFDELRDTQVQRLALAGMRQAFPAARAFYRHLKNREARFSRRSRKDVKRIKTKRLQKLLTACRQELKQWRRRHRPEQANARLLAAVGGAFERTARLKDQIARNDTATIHRTRVAFKKFRYMVETLAPHLPFANEKLLAAMHHYQTMMGEVQDVEVLLRAFDEFLREEKLERLEARRFRAEWLRRRRWLVRVYLDAAGQLCEFWPWAGPPTATSPALSHPASPPLASGPGSRTTHT